MPRTITIDELQLLELRVVKQGDEKAPRIFVGYNLTSGKGKQIVQTIQQEITESLSTERKQAVLSFFDAVAADLTTTELG